MSNLRDQLETVIGYITGEVDHFELFEEPRARTSTEKPKTADEIGKPSKADTIEVMKNLKNGALWLEQNLDEILANAEYEKTESI